MIKPFIKEYGFPLMLFVAVMVAGIVHEWPAADKEKEKTGITLAETEITMAVDTLWHGPSESGIPRGTDSGDLIWYGKELIENTAYYLGPKGKVRHISNGMNCQNCHLRGGTAPYANNFGKVYATYPLYRARNNGIQTIYDRINDCLERSLNGEKLDSTVLEMKAIYAYMKWLGEGVPKGVAKGGTTTIKLPYLDRAADPVAGKAVFLTNCQTCHGSNGQGLLNPDGTGYTYPPLWGEHSFNDGAGLYRLGGFASFVKNNMPFGTTYHSPKLTDEEAWDVAAYVNSQPRPHKDPSVDWHILEKKPIDFPYGPYTDTFSEKQHKYGPFKPIKAAHDKLNKHL